MINENYENFEKAITSFFSVKEHEKGGINTGTEIRRSKYSLSHTCYVTLVRAPYIGFLAIKQMELSSFTTFQDIGGFNSCLLAKRFEILGLKCKVFFL